MKMQLKNTIKKTQIWTISEFVHSKTSTTVEIFTEWTAV